MAPMSFSLPVNGRLKKTLSELGFGYGTDALWPIIRPIMLPTNSSAAIACRHCRFSFCSRFQVRRFYLVRPAVSCQRFAWAWTMRRGTKWGVE